MTHHCDRKVRRHIPCDDCEGDDSGEAAGGISSTPQAIVAAVPGESSRTLPAFVLRRFGVGASVGAGAGDAEPIGEEATSWPAAAALRALSGTTKKRRSSSNISATSSSASVSCAWLRWAADCARKALIVASRRRDKAR